MTIFEFLAWFFFVIFLIACNFSLLRILRALVLTRPDDK